MRPDLIFEKGEFFRFFIKRFLEERSGRDMYLRFFVTFHMFSPRKKGERKSKRIAYKITAKVIILAESFQDEYSKNSLRLEF